MLFDVSIFSGVGFRVLEAFLVDADPSTALEQHFIVNILLPSGGFTVGLLCQVPIFSAVGISCAFLEVVGTTIESVGLSKVPGTSPLELSRCKCNM